MLNFVPFILGFSFYWSEGVFYLLCKLLKLYFFLDSYLAHYIAESVVISDVGVLIFGPI